MLPPQQREQILASFPLKLHYLQLNLEETDIAEASVEQLAPQEEKR